MDFCERVFQARKAKGYSQEDLAEMVSVSRQAVSKWETGEAMPDMEKFIALCDALNLNMEYLALGKESAAPAAAPKKGLRFWGVALLAASCLAVGLLAGYLLPHPQPQAEPQPTQPQLSTTQSVVVQDSPISDVIVDATSSKQVKLSILPKMISEETQVTILCQNKRTGKTQTLPCEFDGNYYCVNLPRDGEFQYYITAVLTTEGKKEQLPIVELTGDRNTCTSRHIWKNP